MMRYIFFFSLALHIASTVLNETHILHANRPETVISTFTTRRTTTRPHRIYPWERHRYQAYLRNRQRYTTRSFIKPTLRAKSESSELEKTTTAATFTTTLSSSLETLNKPTFNTTSPLPAFNESVTSFNESATTHAPKPEQTASDFPRTVSDTSFATNIAHRHPWNTFRIQTFLRKQTTYFPKTNSINETVESDSVQSTFSPPLNETVETATNSGLNATYEAAFGIYIENQTSSVNTTRASATTSKLWHRTYPWDRYRISKHQLGFPTSASKIVSQETLAKRRRIVYISLTVILLAIGACVFITLFLVLRKKRVNTRAVQEFRNQNGTDGSYQYIEPRNFRDSVPIELPPPIPTFEILHEPAQTGRLISVYADQEMR